MFEKYKNEKALIVGVSGGADSLALTHMLCSWSKQNQGPEIHAVTIDHALRSESAAEAKKVSDIASNFPNCIHKIMRWEDDKPDSKLQEEARTKRYELLSEYARQNSINYIFVAHHQDDQAETFLIRLSKGSGLDGLACMSELQEREGLHIIRPLIDYAHQDLIEYCKSHNIEWIEDPSNQNEDFLRPRLRKARGVLEAEGLTSKRLSTTAKRMARAREALETITNQLWESCVTKEDKFSIDYETWKAQPEEIRLRLVLEALNQFREGKSYAPRMEKVEELAERLLDLEYKTSTLGGCIISLDKKKAGICFEKE